MKCHYCGQPFKKKYRNQKYCSTHCRTEARREKRRIYNSRYFYKNRKKLYHTLPGTRTIGAHPNPDPDKEKQIIEKELTRHGLKNVLTL